jgi:hypothetical protein
MPSLRLGMGDEKYQEACTLSALQFPLLESAESEEIKS